MPPPASELPAAGNAAVHVSGLTRRFGAKVAVDSASMVINPGEIHALLGPNGAGKTTLLKMLTGLVQPDEGELTVVGRSFSEMNHRRSRGLIGLVPSGDRTFYLRLSGLENLLFFGRLHGLRRRDARARALQLLTDVGLEDAARRRVGTYSHGMHKRLSLARALLTEPAVLLVDEATHDLDPSAARQARDMIAKLARRGTAVLWTTQRIDEIRGFADTVTVLDDGRVRFQGTVSQLMAIAATRRYLVRLESGTVRGPTLTQSANSALDDLGVIHAPNAAAPNDHILHLRDDVVLGDAICSLSAAGLAVLSCREERSEIEAAYLNIVLGEWDD